MQYWFKLALLLSFIFSIKAIAQPTPTFQGVDYVGNGSIHQRMDIYIPPGLNAPAPVIMFIHGGGWAGGGKGAPNVPYFEPSYNAGFICVDINYRLSSINIWPAQIEDCKAAVRFLRANAVTYGIDKCRFGVMGSSAGGHLSAMMGTSANVAALEGAYLGNATESSEIQAVVDLFGPTNFALMDGNYSASCGSTGMVHDSNSFETNLLGITSLSGNSAIVQTANPITYITANDAKFWIMHGSNDCSVPTNQSVILKDALTTAGVTNTYSVAPNQGHGGPYYLNPARGQLYRDFFLTHLSTPCATLQVSNSTSDLFSFYYNPDLDILQLTLNNFKPYSVEMFNTLGTKVWDTNNQLQIPLKNFQPGIYVLKVVIGNKTFTRKVIKG